MLEGIHILSETIKYTANVWVAIGGAIIGIFALLLIWIFVIAVKNNDVDGSAILLLLVAILFGFLSYASIDDYIGRKLFKEYKVTIDDNVSLTEFNEEYKIVNQEGKIYTIQEKLK